MFKFLLVSATLVAFVVGHGSVHEPVARQSRWRYDPTATPNTNDYALNCGNFNTHIVVNEGRCGLCGDNYAERAPRSHELGGTFGQGVIVQSYRIGQQIFVRVRITQNHRGYFLFDLCNLDQNGGIESAECFARNPLRLANGADRYVMQTFVNDFYETTVQLPAGMRCDHCVFRWTYVTANRWGTCADGTGALGCGSQENFVACSDIAIN